VRGNHLIVLSSRGRDGVAPVLAWKPPGASDFEGVDDARLFAGPDGGNGLVATFYPTQDFAGAPTESMVDPILAHYYHVNPFARRNLSPPTWSVEWTGELDAPASGAYGFDVERLSRAGLWIDGRSIFDDTEDGSLPAVLGAVQLTAGRHQVRVRLRDRGDGGPRLYLYWTPPGGGRELVPGRVLYPPPPVPAQTQ
jgi:hypothetical protein